MAASMDANSRSATQVAACIDEARGLNLYTSEDDQALKEVIVDYFTARDASDDSDLSDDEENFDDQDGDAAIDDDIDMISLSEADPDENDDQGLFCTFGSSISFVFKNTV